jgi:hypothetical protein
MSLLHWEHTEALPYAQAADENPPPRGLYRPTRRLRPSVDVPLRQRRGR